MGAAELHCTGVLVSREGTWALVSGQTEAISIREISRRADVEEEQWEQLFARPLEQQ